jgi:hypothetical protein
MKILNDAFMYEAFGSRGVEDVALDYRRLVIDIQEVFRIE